MLFVDVVDILKNIIMHSIFLSVTNSTMLTNLIVFILFLLVGGGELCIRITDKEILKYIYVFF